MLSSDTFRTFDQGRKVRIPHLAHMVSLMRNVVEADLNGLVKDWNAKTDRYTVMMNSGQWERNIQLTQMKVVYHLIK